MAGMDYKHCDKCGTKVFYDANFNYEFEVPNDERVTGRPYAFEGLGDWKTLCKKCSKGYVVAIREKTMQRV